MLREARESWGSTMDLGGPGCATSLDTTLLIDHSKGRPGVAELVESLFAESSDLYTCDVVVAEALTGGDDLQRATIESLIRAIEYLDSTMSRSGPRIRDVVETRSGRAPSLTR